MSGLLSESVRWCVVFEILPLGLGLSDKEVTYGESPLVSVALGEIPPGDKRPYEFILDILLAASE